jgi:hypothetical protein
MKPKKPKEVRATTGRFLPGTSPGPGRPPKATEDRETVETATIRRHVRSELVERGLVDKALSMAEGKPPFHKLGPKTQFGMTMDLWDRSIGKPAAVNIAMIEQRGMDGQGITYIKRIIGIDPDKI